MKTAPLRSLIFDSHYDSYKGVVAYVRLMDGRIHHTDMLHLMATGFDVKPVEIGIFAPDLRPVQDLVAGEVGYIATGLKTVHECRVGDTITNTANPADRTHCRVTARSNRWSSPGSTRWKVKITPT